MFNSKLGWIFYPKNTKICRKITNYQTIILHFDRIYKSDPLGIRAGSKSDDQFGIPL